MSFTQPYMPKSKTDVHLTPPSIFKIIEENWHIKKEDLFDPCPLFHKENGLLIAWKKFNFVNPPYARVPGEKETMLHQFVFKAIREFLHHENISIMLLPSKTDQPWFHELQKYNFRIIWLKGRVKFLGNKFSATQPHFLVLIA